jgi:hypothetical protein
MMASRITRFLTAGSLFALAIGLSAGGKGEAELPASGAAASPSAAPVPTATLPADAASFVGRLEIRGSEPHTFGIVRLDNGRVFLVDPAQWREHPLKTGCYALSGRLSPPRQPLPGLGIPAHDQVVWLLTATEITR